MSTTTFPPRQQSTSKPRRNPAATGATDFLRSNDKLSALLPAVARMIALKKDCATLLPAMFDACAILHLEAGQLVLAVPNAALAAKLKQQLPKLQIGLQKLGWEVSAIRIKVQVIKLEERQETAKNLSMPGNAVAAFAALEGGLEDTKGNQGLKAALRALVERRR